MKATSHLKGYGLAILACVIASLVAWPTRTNATTLIGAVLLSGLYCGRGPGFMSIGLTSLSFWILVGLQLPPTPDRGLRTFMYAVTAALVNQLVFSKLRAEEARSQSDTYSRIVAMTATDAMLLIDDQERIVFANAATTQIFGWSEAELIGKPLARLIPEFPRTEESPIAREVVAWRKGGSEFPAEISFTAVMRDGRRHMTGFVRDISALKQSQAMLQKSESYLAEAQKLSHTGSLGYNLTTGEIFWSEETYRIAGFEIGSSLPPERLMERVHPEDRGRVRAIFDRAQHGEEADWDYEHRLLFPDGSIKYVHMVGHATHNTLGQTEFIGAVTDTTAARKAEEELRRSEERYRDLIELAPDAIMVVDENGRLVLTNQVGLEMLGCSAKEAVGYDIAQTHLPEDRPGYRSRLQLLRIGRTFQFERTFLRKDGSTLPVEVSVSPIRDGYSQAVLRDIRERKRTQEALQRSEFYLSEAEKLSHMGSWAIDVRSWRFIYYSAECLRLQGYDPAGPLPTFDHESLHYSPEDWEWIRAELKRTLEHKTDHDFEVTRRKPDGTLQHVRIVGHPVVGATGEVLELIGTTIDITEQWKARATLKEAFEALRRSEDQLRLITDTIPTQAWRSAPDGSVEFVNRRYVEYTGLSTEQVRGWAWMALIHPWDLAAVMDNFNMARAGGRATEVEGRVRRVDGEYRWFLFRIVPLRDESGRIVNWYGTSTDIEDLKRAEQALLESEHNLRLILDTIPALVWSAAPDGRLEAVNQRIVGYLGVSVNDLVHPGWGDFLHPDDAGVAMRSWMKAVAQGTQHEAECRIRCADGVYRWFHVRAQPLRNDEGRIVRWYGLMADIEERRRATEVLRLTQARLSRAMQIATIGEFAASLAHEVNQPLAAVVANGHACRRWLMAQPPNLMEANLAAERIVRDGNGAAEVVRRVRALFKQAEPEKTLLDVHEVLSEVIRLLRSELVRTGVLLETEQKEALPPILADRVQLQQVFFNLLQNGIEAMDGVVDRPKRLTIRLQRHSADTILVQIRDHGTGMKDLDRPFEAFYTTKQSGLGMGLALCRSIVVAHRGALWAAPTEGPGATFCLTLPLSLEDGETSQTKKELQDVRSS
jgi:PAS domain S-box-containing protein